jgi:hypothetical protein
MQVASGTRRRADHVRQLAITSDGAWIWNR